MIKQKLFKNYTRLVAISFLSVVVFSGCGKGCMNKMSSGKSESLALIPVDSNFVLGLHWDKISESPLGEKIKKNLPPEAAPYVKDIKGAVLGFGFANAAKGPENVVAIIDGKLDSAAWLAQMAEQAKKNGGTITEEQYEGVKISSASNDPTVGVAFVGDHAILGKKEAVKKSIELSKGKGDSIEKNKEVMEIIKGTDQGKMVWAAGKVPEGAIPAGAGGPANPMAALSVLKGLDLGMDFSKGLSLDLGLFAATDDEAKQLLNTLNSFKTLFGTSMAMQNPALGKVLQNLTVEQKSKRVAVGLKLDQATVDELSKQQAAMPPSAAPEGMEEKVAPPAPNAAPATAPGAQAPAAPAEEVQD